MSVDIASISPARGASSAQSSPMPMVPLAASAGRAAARRAKKRSISENSERMVAKGERLIVANCG
jgi:hypothetical protein